MTPLGEWGRGLGRDPPGLLPWDAKEKQGVGTAPLGTAGKRAPPRPPHGSWGLLAPRLQPPPPPLLPCPPLPPPSLPRPAPAQVGRCPPSAHSRGGGSPRRAGGRGSASRLRRLFGIVEMLRHSGRGGRERERERDGRPGAWTGAIHMQKRPHKFPGCRRGRRTAPAVSRLPALPYSIPAIFVCIAVSHQKCVLCPPPGPRIPLARRAAVFTAGPGAGRGPGLPRQRRLFMPAPPACPSASGLFI